MPSTSIGVYSSMCNFVLLRTVIWFESIVQKELKKHLSTKNKEKNLKRIFKSELKKGTN